MVTYLCLLLLVYLSNSVKLVGIKLKNFDVCEHGGLNGIQDNNPQTGFALGYKKFFIQKFKQKIAKEIYDEFFCIITQILLSLVDMTTIQIFLIFRMFENIVQEKVNGIVSAM